MKQILKEIYQKLYLQELLYTKILKDIPNKMQYFNETINFYLEKIILKKININLIKKMLIDFNMSQDSFENDYIILLIKNKKVINLIKKDDKFYLSIIFKLRMIYNSRK